MGRYYVVQGAQLDALRRLREVAGRSGRKVQAGGDTCVCVYIYIYIYMYIYIYN